jgi:molybdate-binding protein
MDAQLRWVGREPGSGARQCLDELFGDRRPPRRLASSHRGVAEAVRSGWADAGVCLRLVTEEAGLDFLLVRTSAKSFMIVASRNSGRENTGIRLSSASYARPRRRALDELPGYSSAGSGELQRIS